MEVMWKPLCHCPWGLRCGWTYGSSKSDSRQWLWFGPATLVLEWASNLRACPTTPNNASRLTSKRSIPAFRSATKTANNSLSPRGDSLHSCKICNHCAFQPSNHRNDEKAARAHEDRNHLLSDVRR